jgi:triphosphatase
MRALATMAAGPAVAARRLISTYYDTPELRLRHLGMTLRVREQEGCFIQTVKRDGADALRRGEWEDQLADCRPDPNAAESGKQLPDDVGEDLRPLFATHVTRTTVELEPAPSTHIEAAIDEGEIRAASGEQTAPVSEIELELKSGDAAALYDVAVRLLETAPVRIEPRSKSERGYELGNPAPAAVHASTVVLDPLMTVEVALQSLGRSCLAHLLQNETAALARQPEGVHQMRVALRRLRSAIAAFKDLLPVEDRRWISDELKWLLGILGAARNLDVFATDLLPPAKLRSMQRPGVDDLSAALESSRRTAYDRVEEAVLSERHASGMLRLSRWFEACAWRYRSGTEPAKRLAAPIGKLAPHVLDRGWRQLLRRSKGFGRQTPHQRHKLRIAAKKLRYSVELLESLFDPQETEGFVKRLKRLQDNLGYNNDVRVAHQIVHDLSEQTSGSAAAEAGLRVLEFHQEAQAKSEWKLRKRLRQLKQADPFWRKKKAPHARSEQA